MHLYLSKSLKICAQSRYKCACSLKLSTTTSYVVWVVDPHESSVDLSATHTFLPYRRLPVNLYSLSFFMLLSVLPPLTHCWLKQQQFNAWEKCLKQAINLAGAQSLTAAALTTKSSPSFYYYVCMFVCAICCKCFYLHLFIYFPTKVLQLNGE